MSIFPKAASTCPVVPLPTFTFPPPTRRMSAVTAWCKSFIHTLIAQVSSLFKKAQFIADRSHNRAWHIRQTPYLARVESPASRQAIAMSQNNTTDGAVVINMNEIGSSNTPTSNATQEKKKQDTLFGPNIGIVSNGPKWTERTEKSSDELTPEIVKAWVQKSKEVRSVGSLRTSSHVLMLV